MRREYEKGLFSCELVNGHGNQGGQKKRFNDCLKCNVKKCTLNTETSETVLRTGVHGTLLFIEAQQFETDRISELS